MRNCFLDTHSLQIPSGALAALPTSIGPVLFPFTFSPMKVLSSQALKFLSAGKGLCLPSLLRTVASYSSSDRLDSTENCSQAQWGQGRLWNCVCFIPPSKTCGKNCLQAHPHLIKPFNSRAWGCRCWFLSQTRQEVGGFSRKARLFLLQAAEECASGKKK